MRRAFKDLKASKDPQVTTFCLSNSNEIYIKTILEVRPPTCPLSLDRELIRPTPWLAALQRDRRI